jgi:hypothetical protein
MRNVSDKFVEKVKTHIVFSITFPESRGVFDIVWEKYGRARQITGDNMAHAHCTLNNQGYTHARARTHMYMYVYTQTLNMF